VEVLQHRLGLPQVQLHPLISVGEEKLPAVLVVGVHELHDGVAQVGEAEEEGLFGLREAGQVLEGKEAPP